MGSVWLSLGHIRSSPGRPVYGLDGERVFLVVDVKVSDCLSRIRTRDDTLIAQQDDIFHLDIMSRI